MADSFPGAFTGYSMTVAESHQSSKVDTSGTAKAIVASFQELGVQFAEEQIEMVRQPAEQTARMAVPEAHLLGHAFHTYELTSPDGMVQLKFEHNVCGRSIYAEVRATAARWARGFVGKPHLESRPRASARFFLEESAGWVSPYSAPPEGWRRRSAARRRDAESFPWGAWWCAGHGGCGAVPRLQNQTGILQEVVQHDRGAPGGQHAVRGVFRSLSSFSICFLPYQFNT